MDTTCFIQESRQGNILSLGSFFRKEVLQTNLQEDKAMNYVIVDLEMV